MPRFQNHEAKQLISRADHVKHIVFFGPLSETAFCTGMSSMLKNLPFSPGYETRLLDPESDRSKICLLFPFRGEREVGKQKYEIAQSQSRENTLSIYVDIVLHSIYFNDNRYVE